MNKCYSNTVKLVNEFSENFKNTYDIKILNSSSNSRNINIQIFCRLHQEYYQTTAYSLKRHNPCSCCHSIIYRFKVVEQTETKLLACIKKFGDKFIYDENFVYTGVDNHIKFTCKKHGLQCMIYRTHLNGLGCAQCAKHDNENLTKRTKERFCDFIKNNNKYDYSRVNYKGIKTKVEIICKEHGSFFQRPQNHMRGEGCPKCSVVKANKTKLEMGYGNNFSRSSYGKFKGDSNVYVFKLYNKNELFYKIGITKNIGSRIKLLNKDGYNVDCLYNYKSTCLDCWDIEKMLHFNFKNIRYTPKLKFKGSTECFNFVDIKDVDFLIQCCR